MYSGLPISLGHFSPNNSRKTPIARPLGRGMGVLREFKVWPKLYHRSCCAVCNFFFIFYRDISRVFCIAILFKKNMYTFVKWNLPEMKSQMEIDPGIWNVRKMRFESVESDCPWSLSNLSRRGSHYLCVYFATQSAGYDNPATPASRSDL